MITFILLIISVLCVIAYLRNIYRIIPDAKNFRGGMILARILGIFIFPLGILLGVI